MKKVHYTKAQKEVLHELSDGTKTIWLSGEDNPRIGTGHGSVCDNCGQECESKKVNLQTFKALVKKGALVPNEYWLSEELSEEL